MPSIAELRESLTPKAEIKVPWDYVAEILGDLQYVNQVCSKPDILNTRVNDKLFIRQVAKAQMQKHILQKLGIDADHTDPSGITQDVILDQDTAVSLMEEYLIWTIAEHKIEELLVRGDINNVDEYMERRVRAFYDWNIADGKQSGISMFILRALPQYHQTLVDIYRQNKDN